MEQNKEREDRRSQLEHGALVKKTKLKGFRKEVHKTDRYILTHRTETQGPKQGFSNTQAKAKKKH